MADDEKKSTNQILQALDALSHLSQAHATRRTTSLALPRSGSAKDGSDAGAVDAVVEEARPRPRLRRRLSPRSPFWPKPKLDKNGNYDDEEDDDDAALIVIIKNQGLSLMLPSRSRSKQDKKEDDDNDEQEEDDDSSTHSTAAPEADGEKKGIMSWGPTRAMWHIGMRRMGCLFSLELVAAQGLPPSLNGLRVAVTVRRKETRDGAAQSMPARVQLGAADFDEVLYVRCHLYGTGGGATGKPLSFEPRPFLLSLIAINAPELDFGRSTVDLSLFAKEFTDKCVRQWDMVFPLGGKAKGGELVVKLAFQSIDDGGAGSYTQRKLRRSSISNMLTPKITHAKTPKMGVSAPDLRAIDSFMLDEPEPALTPIAEVKETQQKEPEREAAEPTPMAEVKEEEQQKELEREAAELTLVAEVKEEQQAELELETADLTPVAEVKEEEQQKELEREAVELTPVAEVKEEQQKELELEAADLTLVAEVKEEEQQKELEREVAELTPAAEVKEDEQQKEPEHEPADEPNPEAEVEEDEQQKEPERESEDAQEDDDSELPEFNVMDKGVHGQVVKAELKEETEAEKGSEEEEEEEASLVASDEVAKAVANGLEEKSVLATMPSDVSDAVADAVKTVDVEVARLKEFTGDSLQMPEQGEDKDAAAKPSRPRFKWRTVALLVPIAVMVSETLGAKR